MVLGALNSWSAICAIVFFVGFGLGGNIPIDATIVLEFIPNVRAFDDPRFCYTVSCAFQDRRYLLAALSVFQPIGTVRPFRAIS